MNISNKRLAKDDELAISDSQLGHFANGKSLMHGTLLIANRKSFYEYN